MARILRRDGRRDSASLTGVLRRIHREEVRPSVCRRPFDDDATAERCLRREFLLPDFDIDDVPMLGN